MQHLKMSLLIIVMSLGLVGFNSLGAAAAEERLSGTQFDSRVILAFKTPDAAAQEWMPEGWKALTFPKGPFAGANLLVILVDRHLNLDPESNPTATPAVRGAVLVSFGVQPGSKGPKGFVTRAYMTDVGDDPYSVSVPARIARDSAIEGPAGEPGTRREVWEVNPEAGGSFSLSLSHTAGVPVKSQGETLSHSAVNPEYYHIYRYEQLADLAMSEGLGKPLSGEVSVSAEIPEIAALFDGTERLVAVISLPWYWRDTFKP